MAAFLLNWNPANWTWPEADYRKFADAVQRGKPPSGRWSVGGTKQIRKGDRLFLQRQGNASPLGIIGYGTAVTDWYEDHHYDKARANQGDVTTYVDIRFERLVDFYAHVDQILSRELLNHLVPGLDTAARRSGQVIADDVVVAIDQLWTKKRLKINRDESLPETITRADILEAANDFDKGTWPPTFDDSDGYDLIVDEKRYPPKIIAALAARRSRGRVMFSQEFRGGEGTKCFTILRREGFDVVSKRAVTPSFAIGATYTRDLIRKELKLNPVKGGNWATGHARLGKDTFIFANVESEGRTGHNYKNRWVDGKLHWSTKGPLSQKSATVQDMLKPPPGGHVYVFWRSGNRDSFAYAGVGIPDAVNGNRPVSIVWRFQDNEASHVYPDEVDAGVEYTEGSTKTIRVNVYERSPAARRDCLLHHGYSCKVCKFNFQDFYGAIGGDFIHVHHKKPLAKINRGYKVDPVQDLEPVCPNCHAMLHSREPVYTSAELRRMLRKVNKKSAPR